MTEDVCRRNGSNCTGCPPRCCRLTGTRICRIRRSSRRCSQKSDCHCSPHLRIYRRRPGDPLLRRLLRSRCRYYRLLCCCRSSGYISRVDCPRRYCSLWCSRCNRRRDVCRTRSADIPIEIHCWNGIELRNECRQSCYPRTGSL